MEIRINHDVGHGLEKSVCILACDNGCFEDRGVRNQCALNFGGIKPAPVYFEQIIGAPSVPKVAVLILVVFISSAKPMPLDFVLGLFVLVPVGRADRISLHQQIARFAGSNRLLIFIDDLGFVAGYYLAARPWSHSSGAVG